MRVHQHDYYAHFRLFHRNNPHVYDAIVNLCREIKALGENHFGIDGVFAVLRYNILKGISTIDDHSFYKINNNYRAYYARLVIAQNEDLTDFLFTRTAPADYQIASYLDELALQNHLQRQRDLFKPDPVDLKGDDDENKRYN